MNIRFSCSVFLIFAVITAGLPAQQAQGRTPAVVGRAGAPSAGISQLPDEKNLVIAYPPAEAQAARPIKGVGVWDFVQMILVLALVVGAIYLLFYFIKKAGASKLPDNNLINLLSTRSLQQNRSLHLVEVGKEIFLVGSSEGGVALVARIEDKESLDEIRLKASERGPYLGKRGTFREVFAGMFGGGGFHFGGSIAETMGFMRRQRDRLKKL